MKMKKYLLLVVFFYFNNNLYSQWDLKINGLPDWNVCNVLDVAVDSTIVTFVKADYFPRPISISTNLANFWYNYNTPDMWEGTDVSILDKNNIWFCTGDGKIYYSNDGCINWVMQYADTINYPFLDFIKIFDNNNGIVIGDAISAQLPAVVLKTTDGGNNWISINGNYLIGEWSRDAFYTIEFPTPSTGYFYGSRSAKLFKTIDGGTSWQIVSLPDGVNSVYMIKFYNEDWGMLISDLFPGDDFLYRTIDGGNNWNKLSLLTDSNHHDIEFLPGTPSQVWFTDYDHLFFSADTGNTWQEVTIVGDSLGARNIEFLNDSLETSPNLHKSNSPCSIVCRPCRRPV